MQRFWEKVEKREGCWEWQAALHVKGYGRFYFRGRVVLAHRASWVLAHGDVPGGLHVLHHCDNPRCVRPSHLWLGTNADNMRDRNEKGRQAQGVRVGSAVLVPHQVREIRELLKQGDGKTDIARKYGVSLGCIRGIANGRNWKNLN